MMEPLPAAAYERAEKLLAHNRQRLVLRADVEPHWIGGGDEFWYRIETERGGEFILARPDRGERRPAFDHDRLARSLAQASGNAVEPYDLPFTEIEIAGSRFEFDAFGQRWACAFADHVCQRVGSATATPGPLEIVSPDGRRSILRRGHDLWLRDLENGETRRLTDDGSATRRYAATPTALDFFHLLRKHGNAELPPLVLWSPDSSRILTHRLDETEVEPLTLVEAVPPGGGRPRSHTYPYAIPGEPAPSAEWLVFDVGTGSVVTARDEPFSLPVVAPIGGDEAWWTADGTSVRYLEHSRDRRTMWLKSMDTATGEVSVLIEESGPTRVEAMQELGQPPNVCFIADDREVLWYSQRDGWGHLYLYDLESGELRRQVTAGEYAVQEIVHVDDVQRVAFVLVSGLVPADPYRRVLICVGLDDGELRLLQDDGLDHAVVAAPHGRWFIDSASAVDEPPVTSVRDRAGRVLVELERADVSPLLAVGWTPPERVHALAADGSTEVYGVLYRPFGFDPAQRYAILDHPYPGPQMKRVPPSFDQGFFGPDAEAAAAVGFAVLAIDGRGTPGRDKAFHDYSYGNLGSCGLEDHVAALQQLGAERSWIDLDRVGVFGISAGGFATARAMLAHAETYKVGVAEAGNHDNRYYHAGWAEAYNGPFDPQAGEVLSNTELADRLRGRLLLVHGEVDENVAPHLTMRLVERLIAADKDFDLLIVPGAEHYFAGYQHYVVRRRWDYLVRHLMDREPPKFQLTPAPVEPFGQAELLGLMRA